MFSGRKLVAPPNLIIPSKRHGFCFLKYLDDLEQERALAAELVSRPYSFIIDKPHRWSKWAAHGNFDHDKALTGDDLIATRHYHDFDPKTGEEYQLQPLAQNGRAVFRSDGCWREAG